MIKANSAFMLHQGGRAAKGDAPSLHAGPRGRAGAGRPCVGLWVGLRGPHMSACPPLPVSLTEAFVLSVGGCVLMGLL